MPHKNSIFLFGLYCFITAISTINAASETINPSQAAKIWHRKYTAEHAFALNNEWYDLAAHLDTDPYVRHAVSESLNDYDKCPQEKPKKPYTLVMSSPEKSKPAYSDDQEYKRLQNEAPHNKLYHFALGQRWLIVAATVFTDPKVRHALSVVKEYSRTQHPVRMSEQQFLSLGDNPKPAKIFEICYCNELRDFALSRGWLRIAQLVYSSEIARDKVAVIAKFYHNKHFIMSEELAASSGLSVAVLTKFLVTPKEEYIHLQSIHNKYGKRIMARLA